jgi:hypothetical protein
MGRMVVVVAATLVLGGAGCKEDEHFPPGEGGGPGGGGGGTRDAGNDEDAGDVDAGDGGTQLTGRLCDVTDVRDPLDVGCDGPAGIDVSVLDSVQSAETVAEGDFTLNVEFDSSLLLAIGTDDDSARNSLVQVGMWDDDGLRVPHVTQVAWSDLLSSLSIGDTDGAAALLLYVEDSERQPLAGAVVDAIGSAPIFHDDDGNKDGWSPGGTTGPRGAALMVQVPAQEEEVVVTVDGEPFDIPVRPDRLTWARVP